MIIRLHFTTVEMGSRVDAFDSALAATFGTFERATKPWREGGDHWVSEHCRLVYYDTEGLSAADPWVRNTAEYEPLTEACKLWMMLNVPADAEIQEA